MCSRRNKPILQGAVLLALVGGLAYTFYLYNLTIMDLETSRSEADKYLKQQESLSSQLQVVYEHRARLERSLQKEKTDHKNSKLDFSKKQNDFLLNVTRSKHEAMNRFNSLETQYNMLKAQAKELETEYSRIQRQYSRLSSEHNQVNNQQRRNFQLFKEQKANEIASLDDEIKALKQQVVSLRTHLKSKTEEAEQHKVASSRAMAANKRYQEILKPLQEELANYKEKLKNPFVQPRTNEASRNVKQDRVERTEARYQGDHVVDSNEQRVDERENVGKPPEKESATEPPRSDSRHHQDHSRQQRDVQIKAPSDNDLREPLHEDANKQEQHVNDESQIRNGIHPRGSDQDKARDNSPDDGYPRHGNVPLRDSNQDVRIADKEPVTQVTSPVKNNAMNKWSDILKAAEQSHYGKREEGGDKAVKEEWEENKREEMKTPDEDRKELGEEEAADEQIDKPVAQVGRVGDRLGLQGGQHINAREAQGDSERRNQENEENDKGDKGEEGAGGLSREKMNKQMAELEESYQQKQLQQQEQLKAAQSQQQVDGRRSMAADNKVVPIPAVQRQDKADEEHKTQADADSDDEDADKPNNEKEDPDEEDPDDAGEEEDDNMEDQQQQQQRVHQNIQRHQGNRKYDRSLKAAAATDDNNQHNTQESKRT